MIRRLAIALFCAGAVLGAGTALGQEEVDTLRVIKVGGKWQPIDDTTTVYHLGAVIVGSRPTRIRSANTVQSVSLASLDRVDAVNVAQLGRLIPSGYIQTNSRGESLLYLRNTGERQVALFFDGALLNIPWDNRIDLDLVPASVLGGLSISKGAASAAYGANVMGGAVNLVTRSLNGPGNFSEVDVQAGNAGLAEATAVHLGRTESVQYVASIGYIKRDGVPLSSQADLPFGQPDPDIRTNTDLRRFNAFGRGAYTLDNGTTLSLTASFVEAEKGTAPEGHKDPAVSSSIRYWRYPDWRNLMLIGSAGRDPDAEHSVGFRGAVWLNRFEQGIVSYKSSDYRTPEARQDDDDVTAGGRLVLLRPISNSEIRFSANGTYSRHRQVEESAGSGIDQAFKQILGSAGVEADIRPGGPFWYSASFNVDVQAVPDVDFPHEEDAQPAEFENPEANFDAGGMIGAVFQTSPGLLVRGSIGRKSRFPTMRERYAGALGRFVVNPDLDSEKALLGEGAVEISRRKASAELVAFVNFTSDTIDQDVIEVEDEVKRIRINLGGSRSFGLEARVTAKPVSGLLVEANGMLNHLRAENPETGEYDRRLTERPNALLSLSGTYNHRSGATVGFSAVHTGEAFSLDDPGEFVRLSPSTVLSGRAGYRFRLDRSERLTMELFGRVNNAFDTLVENQLGLPGPGRSLIVGAKIGV